MGNLAILRSSFSENTATLYGGGLMNDSPTIPGQTNPILTALLRLSREHSHPQYRGRQRRWHLQ